MKINKPLLLVLLLAILLRFWNINNLPSLNPDEAALGYNAYSLLLTGKDEHGAIFPLHFKSFGDYKPGGYVYLAMPFIKIIGLTPLAVRLPNLIFSILTIFIVYKIVYLLSLDFRLSNLVAFILAVNPWHIHFSRGAWESSTALFFIVLGIYWFYSYLLNHKTIFLYLFPFPFVFSLYIYHSARIIAPLIVLSLLIIYFKHLKKDFSKLIISSVFALFLVIPVLYSFLHSGGAARFGGVGLTADLGPINRSEELLNQHGNTLLINRIIHNKRLLYVLSWSQKYTSHFNFNFLFLNGDEVPRSKSPEMGQFYLFELPFLLLGLYLIIHTSYFLHHKSFLLLFLFIAPLASSLTFQAPSALRALPMVIPLSIFISLGLNKFFSKTYFKISIAALYFFSILFFLDAYFIHAPKRYPFAWNSGFPQVINYINSHKSNYQNIYFTDKYDQPYILYLFYSKYPPVQIQSQISLTPPDKFGFSTVSQIDSIHFEKINWQSIPTNSLIIASDENIPQTPIDIINFPNGSPGFKIYVK